MASRSNNRERKTYSTKECVSCSNNNDESQERGRSQKRYWTGGNTSDYTNYNTPKKAMNPRTSPETRKFHSTF